MAKLKDLIREDYWKFKTIVGRELTIDEHVGMETDFRETENGQYIMIRCFDEKTGDKDDLSLALSQKNNKSKQLMALAKVMPVGDWYGHRFCVKAILGTDAKPTYVLEGRGKGEMADQKRLDRFQDPVSKIMKRLKFLETSGYVITDETLNRVVSEVLKDTGMSMMPVSAILEKMKSQGLIVCEEDGGEEGSLGKWKTT